jgi:predicted DsbA family dithiol-disulfide isomerase
MTAIEVYADIWCPFTHVGLRAVLRRRSELGCGGVAVRVRSWPLELVNGAPLDPERTAEHVDELRRQVAPGMFAGFDPDHFPRTTLPALALAIAAYRRDDRTGEAVSLALRDALFEEGLDISGRDVLASIARSHGLPEGDATDYGDVVAEWHEGRARGVKGSPHFFCGTLESFCPSLVITRDEEGGVSLDRNIEALDAFLRECFGAAVVPASTAVSS